jgi:hypothetical protein
MLWNVAGAMGGIRIRDDGGRECELVRPPDVLPRRSWFGRPKVRADDWATLFELQWARAWSGAFGMLVGLSTVFTLGVARWLLVPITGWPVWIGTIGPPVLAGILVWPLAPVVARFFRVWQATEIRAAYLEGRRCAACGYDLAGLEREADGCVRCPECGGAWRVGEQVR